MSSSSLPPFHCLMISIRALDTSWTPQICRASTASASTIADIENAVLPTTACTDLESQSWIHRQWLCQQCFHPTVNSRSINNRGCLSRPRRHLPQGLHRTLPTTTKTHHASPASLAPALKPDVIERHVLWAPVLLRSCFDAEITGPMRPLPQEEHTMQSASATLHRVQSQPAPFCCSSASYREAEAIAPCRQS